MRHRRARSPRPLEPPRLERWDWRGRLGDAGLVFVLGAAFPRLAYWSRWPTRVGPRALLLYTAFNALHGFWQRQWVIPMLIRTHEDHRRLIEQLGRQPTEEEWRAHFLGPDREPRAGRRARLRRPRAARRATRSPDG